MASMRMPRALLRAVRTRAAQRLQLQHAPAEAVCFPPVRRFGSGINGDSDREHASDSVHGEQLNGELSPFERLLQHAQQFRDDAGLDKLPDGIEREFLGDESDERREHDGEPVDEPVPDQEDEHDSDNEEEEDGKHTDDERELHAQASHPRVHSQRRHENHRHRHRDQQRFRQWALNDTLRRKIGRAKDVDFEHGLRDLNPRLAKQRMYEQLLFRGEDVDSVCSNCGERGHTHRHCMLPPICANCGDVGHRRHECPHARFTITQLHATRSGDGKRQSKRVNLGDDAEDHGEEEMRRRIELEAIRERHERMKKAFDDEIDEYVAMQEQRARRKNGEETP